MTELQLRIPTESLRKILNDSPGLMAKLESHAVEKISEEISRKATTKDLKALTETALKNTLEDLRRSMRDPEKWPAELQTTIKEMIRSHLKDQRVEMINAFREELTKMYAEEKKKAATSLEEQTVKMFADVRDNMADIARESFFDVMKEVQAATK